MSDAELHGAAADPVAARLGRGVAILGGRLARLLDGLSAPHEAPLSDGRAFLDAMFEEATGEKPAADPPACALELERTGTEHPIDRLVHALGLIPCEVELILLAAMADEHEGYASMLRALNPRSDPYPTAGLAAQLMCRGMRERLAFRETLEIGAAVSSGVIALTGDAPFFERNLALADSLWPALCGRNVYPAALDPIALRPVTSGLEQWLESGEVMRAQQALGRGEPRLVLMLGDSETSAAHRAAALAASAHVAWAGFDLAPDTPTARVRLALVHSLARGAVPIFRLGVSDSPARPTTPNLEHFPRPVIVCARRGTVAVRTERPVVMLAVDPLPPAAREQLWRGSLPELAEHAPTLASRYVIEPVAAGDVANDFRAHVALDGTSNQLETMTDCIRVRSNLDLPAGMHVIRPRATWGELVLPADRKAQLIEAVQRLTHQETVLDRWKFLEGRPGARGVRVLLSGPPGTGKTLSAEVLARSLGVDLLVVDISRVVSKWIGETEKHLAEAFDAAERSRAVLLFDEADALFGKRTEVSDAHDRYANLETAYLLSRLERFDGLAILSTNLKQNIDTAFLRRIEFVIEFSEPSSAEREALWRCHLPAPAPLADDVNLDELARLYPIVGGLIRNASVAAGFLAAAADTAITRDHLLSAIRREYEKSGKAFPGLPAGALRT